MTCWITNAELINENVFPLAEILEPAYSLWIPRVRQIIHFLVYIFFMWNEIMTVDSHQANGILFIHVFPVPVSMWFFFTVFYPQEKPSCTAHFPTVGQIKGNLIFQVT